MNLSPQPSPQESLSFPADFKTDTNFFNQALAEFNARRRFNLHGVAAGEDLTFYHLLPEEQSEVIDRAQQLKSDAAKQTTVRIPLPPPSPTPDPVPPAPKKSGWFR